MEEIKNEVKELNTGLHYINSYLNKLDFIIIYIEEIKIRKIKVNDIYDFDILSIEGQEDLLCVLNKETQDILNTSINDISNEFYNVFINKNNIYKLNFIELKEYYFEIENFKINKYKEIEEKYNIKINRNISFDFL